MNIFRHNNKDKTQSFFAKEYLQIRDKLASWRNTVFLKERWSKYIREFLRRTGFTINENQKQTKQLLVKQLVDQIISFTKMNRNNSLVMKSSKDVSWINLYLSMSYTKFLKTKQIINNCMMLVFQLVSIYDTYIKNVKI